MRPSVFHLLSTVDGRYEDVGSRLFRFYWGHIWWPANPAGADLLMLKARVFGMETVHLACDLHMYM